jgi:ABC-type long-subunit fatty acid transport system fused permease/ATPase subunit
MAQKNPEFFPKKKSFLQSTYCWSFLAISAQLNQLDHCAAAPFIFIFFGRL